MVELSGGLNGSSKTLLSLMAQHVSVCGKAVSIEGDLKAIGSLRGEPKYKS